VSYSKLIQIYSVIIDFCFECLLCIAKLTYNVTEYKFVRDLFIEDNEFHNQTLVNTCLISIIKMIMHIWINLGSIKYYERFDQFKKMVNLLQGIHELLDKKNLFDKKIFSQPDLYVLRMDLAGRYMCRRFMSATDAEFSYTVPEFHQSISISTESTRCHNQVFILKQNDIYFNDEYNYIKDGKFIISYWIDELYAQNYYEGCPKKYHISNLVKDSRMIHYYAAVALKIYIQCPAKISNKHESSFKRFKDICSEAVLKCPKDFTNHMHALMIFTHQDNLEKEPTSRKFRDVLYQWNCSDMALAIKYLNRDYDGFYTLHMLSLQYLYYASLETLLFLSSELFQALRTYTQDRVEDFLVKISRRWPSLTHGLIWMAEVELHPSEDIKARKVPLDRDDTLPETCKRIIDRIMGKIRKNEKKFYDTETNFFEQITHISSILKPEMSKDQKRKIIKENLIERNKDIPEGVYLPTNPSCIVQSIVETSGAPMQSAQKCPILVAFRVKDKKDMHQILSEEKRVPDEAIDDEGSVEEEKINRLGTTVVRGGRLSNESYFDIKVDEESSDDQVFESHKDVMLESLRKSYNTQAKVDLANSFKTPNSILQQYNSNRINTSFDNSKNRVSMVPKTRFTKAVKKVKHQNSDIKAAKEDNGERVVACIFKTFDDIRQDILALKIVKLFQDIFKVFQLELHLVPYNVICNRTGQEKSIGGIIE